MPNFQYPPFRFFRSTSNDHQSDTLHFNGIKYSTLHNVHTRVSKSMAERIIQKQLKSQRNSRVTNNDNTDQQHKLQHIANGKRSYGERCTKKQLWNFHAKNFRQIECENDFIAVTKKVRLINNNNTIINTGRLRSTRVQLQLIYCKCMSEWLCECMCECVIIVAEG